LRAEEIAAVSMQSFSLLELYK